MTAERQKPSDRWRRVLEYGIMFWVISATLGVVSLAVASLAMPPTQPGYYGTTARVAPAGDGGPLVVIGGLAFLGFLLYSMLFSVIAAVGLYRDARSLAATDLEWQPSPVLYAVGGLVFSWVVVLHYLWKRYEYVPPEPASPVWEKVALACVVGGIGAFVAATVGPPAAFFGLFAFVPALAIAVYYDAKAATAQTDWKPNPVTYFAYVLFSGILLVLPYVVGGYYLYKRQSAS